jgi:hypothetical protein
MTTTPSPASPAPAPTPASSPASGPVADPVARFLDDLAAGGNLDPRILSDDVVLDATVPNWRFELHGPDRVIGQLAAWFADTGEYEWVRRQTTPTGELVEFSFCWEENGVPHAAHQLHLLDIEHGRIWRDTMFCGGRWPAPLLAEMEAARG